MMKKMIEFDANVLMEINGNWVVNAPIVVKDHIHYANGTNNWYPEDQAIFEEELKVTNPAYQAFIQFMKENGYADLSDRELGTAWIIKRGIAEEMCDIGPADLENDRFGKVPKNSFYEMANKHIHTSQQKERRKLLKDVSVKRNKRGPKRNLYHDAYEKHVVSLLPWLRSLSSMKDDKSALLLIGFLLWLGGHSELSRPYELSPPIIEIVDKNGNPRSVVVSFVDYIYGRMRRVYYDSQMVSA